MNPLVLVALLVAAGYLVSLVLHPNSECPRCRGSGKHRGAIYSYASRPCTKCAGSGVQPRLGVRLMRSKR